jgi:hypothetical protein
MAKAAESSVPKLQLKNAFLIFPLHAWFEFS